MKSITAVAIVLGLGIGFSAQAASNAGDLFPGFAGSGHRTTIIGGETVEKSDAIAATTVGLLKASILGTSLCTASIIAEDMLVTAGHCVGGRASSLKIAFRTDIRDSRTFVDAKAFVRHPRYEKDLKDDMDMNDIAVVQFEGGLPAGFESATLLEERDELRDGGTVTLAGYGITSGDKTDSNGPAGILRKVDTTISKALYGTTEVSVDQTQGKGACHGDSGGPAFVRNADGQLRLFGVTSRGPENQPDNCATLGIYTNILAHRAFVKNAIAKLRKQ